MKCECTDLTSSDYQHIIFNDYVLFSAEVPKIQKRRNRNGSFPKRKMVKI